MSDSNEPKVTECWVEEDSEGCPGWWGVSPTEGYGNPAILMWKEDYDSLKASLKHREELYWKLTAEFDAMRGELEELRDKYNAVVKAIEDEIKYLPRCESCGCTDPNCGC